MTRMSVTIAVAAVVVTAVLPALAQQSGQPSDPHHPQQQAPVPGQPAPGQPAPGGGPGGMGGMMGGGMMGEMMRMHGGGMMGHGRGGEGPLGLCPTARMLAHDDARAMSRSLRICGDLLKAMGDVLLKHGAELEKVPAPSAPGPRP